MKRTGGFVTAAAMAGLLLGVSAGASDAFARSNGFDGVWTVMIATSQGNCGTYRAAVQIDRGVVTSPEGDYAVSGNVSPSGAPAVTVTSNQGSAHGIGRLQGASGGGRWRSSSGECSGV